MRKASLLVLLSMTLAACSSSEDPAGGGSLVDCTDDPVTVEVTGELGSKPGVEIPDGAPPCDLVTEDIVEGQGDEARAGSTLQMQYVGVAWSTKTEFDASWDRGQPFSFSLGSGQVISGWDQGIEGMKVGGRRLLVIPSDLAYGEEGSGTIQAGETLVFVVDLVGVTKPPSCTDEEVVLRGSGGIKVEVGGKPNAKPSVDIPNEDPPCALQTVDVIEGDGPEATSGAQLEMQYVGVSWSTGQQFDASWDRGEPFRFVLDTGSVIEGWDKGILGMKEGGRRLLVIPYEQGYGAQGSPPSIAAFETLVFVVDLVRVDTAN